MPSLPFDRLNETNYNDWKIQMEALLEEKGLFGVVSGREEMPLTGPNSKAVRSFLEKQRLARAKIILAIDPSQLPHVRDLDDPAIIWKNLAKIHRARGLGVLITLRREFVTMSMPPGSSISSWVAKIRHAAYCLEECYRAEEEDSEIMSTSSVLTNPTPSPVSELDKVTVLLTGLPPSFQTVIVSITGLPLSKLNFENVVTRLMNEEGRQRNLAALPIPSPSTPSPRDNMAAYVQMTSEKPSSHAGGATRWKGKPGSKPASKNSPVRCHKCGGQGHYRQACPTSDEDAQAHFALDELSLEEAEAHTAVAVEPDQDVGSAW